MQPQALSSYNSFTTKRGNQVWAAALGLAWNELISEFVKENIALEVKGEAKHIMDNFNGKPVTRGDISPDCVYIKSGKGQQTVELINKEVFEKFPERTMSKLEVKLNPLDIISYAYLLKKLQFSVKFERIAEKSFLFGGKKVESFRAEDKKQKQQIRCLYYHSPEDFTIFLESKSKKDFIYFVKTAKQITCDDALQITLKHESGTHTSSLKSHDRFQMPVVDLSCKRQVKELIGAHFLNESMREYIIGEMFQGVKLKIDEAGAKVENEGVIIATRMAMMRPEQPKHCVLDRDFWVVMREPNKHPYVCIHINEPVDLEE